MHAMTWPRRTTPSAARVLGGLLAVALLLCVSPARAGVARFGIDDAEMQLMRAQNPQATETFERGEALAAGGQVQAALTLFEQASAELPDSSLPRRRICEAQTALGRGAENVKDCYMALQMSRTNLAVRAVVRALVTGPELPTTQRLAQAVSLLTMERRRAPNHMALSSALCDVAERTGDGIMLQHCADELVRLAPRAKETRRALERLEARCPPARFWTGWLVIGAALLATAVHALRERLARTARGRLPPAVATAALLGIALLSPPRVARGQSNPPTGKLLTTLPIDDADPESHIPSEADRNRDPLNFGYWLQDTLQKGAIASKRGDHEVAVKYFRAVAKAVPDRSTGYSRVCEEYEALGNREDALASCGAALLHEGVTVGDYARYVHLMLEKPGKLTKAEVDKVDGVIETVSLDPAAHPLVDQLRCELGTRISDEGRLDKCVAALAAVAPDDVRTIEYQWALALQRARFADARLAIVRAKQAGVKDEDLRNMEDETGKVQTQHRWAVALGSAVFLLLAGGLVFAARHFWRNRTRAAASAVPNPAPAESG
jgi:tetratricopeptide (TPR) repeat protein